MIFILRVFSASPTLSLPVKKSFSVLKEAPCHEDWRWSGRLVPRIRNFASHPGPFSVCGMIHWNPLHRGLGGSHSRLPILTGIEPL